MLRLMVSVALAGLVAVAVPAKAQQYWYYCDSAQAYYPYIRACPQPWRRITPKKAILTQAQSSRAAPPEISPATSPPPNAPQPAAKMSCPHGGNTAVLRGVAVQVGSKRGEIWVLKTIKPFCLTLAPPIARFARVQLDQAEIIGQPPPPNVPIELTGTLYVAPLLSDGTELPRLKVRSGRRLRIAETLAEQTNGKMERADIARAIKSELDGASLASWNPASHTTSVVVIWHILGLFPETELGAEMGQVLTLCRAIRKAAPDTTRIDVAVKSPLAQTKDAFGHTLPQQLGLVVELNVPVATLDRFAKNFDFQLYGVYAANRFLVPGTLNPTMIHDWFGAYKSEKDMGGFP